MGSVELRLANTSLPPESVFWGTKSYEDYFGRVGVGSGEFTARHDAFFSEVAVLSLARYANYHRQAVQRLVASGHQGFRLESLSEIGGQMFGEARRGPRDKALFKRLGRRAAMAALFPERMASLGWLRRLQKVTGPIPAVVYTELARNVAVYPDNDFLFTMAQPRARWLDMLGYSSDITGPQVTSALHDQNIDYVCADLAHIQSIPDSQNLLVELARMGAVKEIHLSLGRTDAPAHSQLGHATVQSYRAFVNSAAAARLTPEGEMLVAATEVLPTDEPMPVVLEVNPLTVDGDAMADEYRAIIEHAYELVG